ncbi:WhiB family transcriptional regulator [Gordonia sp. CPCC 205333]|uniref:WhiB family transcriptional regulator n=1 Tax=Gordonia sp. CPCC 205333 TaxID=3140790 RepID=UPI003AF335A4
MPLPHELPGPNADIWDWQMQGMCRGVESSVFFHPDGERGRARAQRERRAKQLCNQCPVLASCREHALAVAEPYGIWGGLSESERAMLIKRGRRRMVS